MNLVNICHIQHSDFGFIDEIVCYIYAVVELDFGFIVEIVC